MQTRRDSCDGCLSNRSPVDGRVECRWEAECREHGRPLYKAPRSDGRLARQLAEGRREWVREVVSSAIEAQDRVGGVEDFVEQASRLVEMRLQWDDACKANPDLKRQYEELRRNVYALQAKAKVRR